MDSNYQIIQKEFEKYGNTLVLDMFEVVLFVGIESDDHDHYYVFQPCKGGGYGNDGKVYWASAVGTFYPLKGVLPDKQYERLVWLWNNNFNTGIAK